MKLIASVQHGFDFQCKRCGQCCSSKTEGMIFLFPEDIENLAIHFGISKAEIVKKYICLVMYTFHVWDEHFEDTGETIALPTLVLNSELDVDCVFLKACGNEKKCTIYAHRPFQCRAYPCWTMFCHRSEELFQDQARECRGFTIQPELQQIYPVYHYTMEEIMETTLAERRIEREYMLAMQAHHNEILNMYPFLREAGFDIGSCNRTQGAKEKKEQ